MQPSRATIEGRNSFWKFLKEIFLNIKGFRFVYYLEYKTTDINFRELSGCLSWSNDNLTGRWHIKIYYNPVPGHGGPKTIIAKFNREEDVMAFKLRWL